MRGPPCPSSSHRCSLRIALSGELRTLGDSGGDSCVSDGSVAGDAPSSVWLRSELSESIVKDDCRSGEDMVESLGLPMASPPAWGCPLTWQALLPLCGITFRRIWR